MSGSTVTPVSIPKWLTLGQLMVGIGAILMFIGFMLGALAASNIPTNGTNGSLSTYQADLVAFFVLTGIGLLVAFAGWGMHTVWPKYKASRLAH